MEGNFFTGWLNCKTRRHLVKDCPGDPWQSFFKVVCAPLPKEEKDYFFDKQSVHGRLLH